MDRSLVCVYIESHQLTCLWAVERNQSTWKKPKQARAQSEKNLCLISLQRIRASVKRHHHIKRRVPFSKANPLFWLCALPFRQVSQNLDWETGRSENMPQLLAFVGIMVMFGTADIFNSNQSDLKSLNYSINAQHPALLCERV